MERDSSQGVKVLCHRVGPALGRGREEAAFGAEEVQVEFGERGSGGGSGRRSRAGRSADSGVTVPASLTWVAKPLATRKMR